MADSREDAHFLHVAVSLVGGGHGTEDELDGFEWHPVPLPARNLGDATGFRNALPDSVRFAGLAGALNLAIDTSTGTPRVQGIALAPRETLRFAASNQNFIRGFLGQISIQLDF